MNIKESKRLDDGVYVEFDNTYYAHHIEKIGNPEQDGRLFDMWSWIHHMRGKKWWNPTLESEFIREVNKYF